LTNKTDALITRQPINHANKTQNWEHHMFGEKIANQILRKEIGKLGTRSEGRKCYTAFSNFPLDEEAKNNFYPPKFSWAIPGYCTIYRREAICRGQIFILFKQ
tara:strand:+ start:159 stop:467 length:309 start_codon:yes stop_codon:yes gene_type:complete